MNFYNKLWYGEYPYIWIFLVVYFPISSIISVVPFFLELNDDKLSFEYIIFINLSLLIHIYISVALWRSANQLDKFYLKNLGKIYAFVIVLPALLGLFGLTLTGGAFVYMNYISDQREAELMRLEQDLNAKLTSMNPSYHYTPQTIPSPIDGK
jgi:hypothetical protein